MKRADIPDIEVVKAVAKYQADIFNEPFPYESLAEKYGCDEKLAFSACERACNHGLVEYGTSLRSGWLTDKGKELLRSAHN